MIATVTSLPATGERRARLERSGVLAARLPARDAQSTHAAGSGRGCNPRVSEIIEPYVRLVATARAAAAVLPPGWVGLFDELCRDLAELARIADWQIRLLRVRAHYGSLQVDWQLPAHPDSETSARSKHGIVGSLALGIRWALLGHRIRARIARTERHSWITCEQCGGPGVLNDKGWWRVECSGPCRTCAPERSGTHPRLGRDPAPSQVGG